MNKVQSSNDGIAPPDGYIGEIKSVSTATAITTSNSNLATLTLTPGTWIVTGGYRFGGDAVARYLIISLSTTSATADTEAGRTVVADYNTVGGVVGATTFSRTFRVTSVASTQTIYLVGLTSSVSGAASFYGYIEAVRIA